MKVPYTFWSPRTKHHFQAGKSSLSVPVSCHLRRKVVEIARNRE